MEEPASDQLDLGQEIAALVRAGCEIRIAPRRSPYGILHVDVLIMPPPTTLLRPTQDEVQFVMDGAPASRPVICKFDLLQPGKLAQDLREVRRFLLG